MNANKDHPEIKNIKNICETSPNTKETKDVCNGLDKEHFNEIDNAPTSEPKNNSSEDSANPGDQYIPKNKKPKDMENEGFNNSPKQIK